jgi:hypothetical protein
MGMHNTTLISSMHACTRDADRAAGEGTKRTSWLLLLRGREGREVLLASRVGSSSSSSSHVSGPRAALALVLRRATTPLLHHGLPPR